MRTGLLVDQGERGVQSTGIPKSRKSIEICQYIDIFVLSANHSITKAA